jgi:DNA repair protein RadC
MTIRSMPPEERPRERLIKEGVEALSLAELIAIILGTGMKGKSALLLAQELTQQFKDLNGLLNATIQELTQIKGMGRAKAIKLRAVFGIALRNNRSQLNPDDLLLTVHQAFELARGEIAHEKKEILFVIARDVRGRLIHSEKISVGTLSEVLVHPREVFYIAVRHKAHSIIIAHNHHSGDPTPSKADMDLTHLLMHSSRVMGIQLDDHLIVTPHKYVSLREQGCLGTARTY